MAEELKQQAAAMTREQHIELAKALVQQAEADLSREVYVALSDEQWEVLLAMEKSVAAAATEEGKVAQELAYQKFKDELHPDYQALRKAAVRGRYTEIAEATGCKVQFD